MSILPPAENGRGGLGLSPPLPFWDWRTLLSPPLPKMGGEEGLRFRKSPELSAYSAADSPEKVKSKNKTRKVRVPANNPFHRNLFSRRFRPPDHCQRLSNFHPVCFC